MSDVKIPEGMTGHEIINDNLYNKGTAFTNAERAALRIDGLLPPVVNTIEWELTSIRISATLLLSLTLHRSVCKVPDNSF